MSTEDTAEAGSKVGLGPLPTSAEDETVVLARLSKTPAEAYERGYMDGAARERERLCEALKIEMQHSAWDGVLQLDDALRNIDDLKA
jgi:hypothetical protein